MPRMSHDLFVRHAIPVRSRHKARPHSVWTDRLKATAFETGLRSPFQEDLPHGIATQPRPLDTAGPVDFSEQWPGLDLRALKLGL